MSIETANAGDTVTVDDRILGEIARASGVRVEEARDHIDTMVRAGWLEIVGTDENGTTTYAFTIPDGER